MTVLYAGLGAFAFVSLLRAGWKWAWEDPIPGWASILAAMAVAVVITIVVDGADDNAVPTGLAGAGAGMVIQRFHRWLGAAGDAYIASVIHLSNRK